MNYRFRALLRLKTVVAVTSISFCAWGSAQAADWPKGPVTLVVPFSAGGTTDVVGRLMAQKLGDLWGSSVVVDNRPGASGNIGASLVARATPDGQTILMASGSNLTVNPHLYKALPYNVEKDFTLVTNVASGPMVVVTSTAVPAKTLKELIDYAKQNPGKLNMGSAGIGSQVHMAGENFADAADIKVTHVPYKGEAAAYTDLMAGQIDMVVGNIGAVSSLVSSGKVRALGVTAKERAKMLADIPTVDESGVPGFVNQGWFAFVVPKKTPQAVVDKLYADTRKVLDMPDVQQRLASLGMQGVGNTSAQLEQEARDESQLWERIIKEQGITLQ